MPIRITGLNSGLDTEALVSELVSAYRVKTQKYTKAQTKLSWKQEAWKDLNSKISSFYSKLTSLRYSSAYNIRSTTVSDTTKATVKASSGAINGSYSVKIIHMAKSGYLTGAELDDSITESSKLSDLGYSAGNGTITVTADGKATDIVVSNDMTISKFVKSLNDAGVKANYDSVNHRIFVASAETGEDSDFSLVGSDANGATALYAMGLSVASKANTAVYEDWAVYSGKSQDEMDILLKSVQGASVIITNNKAQIEYANAYKTVADTGLTDAEAENMLTLLNEKDLDNVYVDADGNIYDKSTSEDGQTVTYTKRETGEVADESTIVNLKSGKDKLEELKQNAGLDDSEISEFKSTLETKINYEADSANETAISDVKSAYANEADFENLIEGLQNTIIDKEDVLSKNAILNNASYKIEDVMSKISSAVDALAGNVKYNTGATRINGQNAEFEINEAKYISTSNDITVNGLSVTALAETGDKAITVNVSNNTQGLYDKIKDILKEYNTLINEMTKLYNAESAKGYEPLTDEERDALSDTEVEKWETKIKDSLLRRDSTLSSLINGMTSAIFKSYTINGKSYSLSSFGIHTLGILNAKDNEENALHIDGDSEDAITAGNKDKLMAALQDDPDTVVEFMKQLTSGLYDSINKKMSSTTLSSYNMVYNDKEMAREYSDYTDTIKKWEEKLADIEDSYYKKFAAMESALATLQAQQSSFASLLGM